MVWITTCGGGSDYGMVLHHMLSIQDQIVLGSDHLNGLWDQGSDDCLLYRVHDGLAVESLDPVATSCDQLSTLLDAYPGWLSG